MADNKRKIGVLEDELKTCDRKRTGDALPRRAQRVAEEGQGLIREAKGLGRAKSVGEA